MTTITMREVKELIGQLTLENFKLQQENEQLKQTIESMVKNEKINPDSIANLDNLVIPKQSVK